MAGFGRHERPKRLTTQFRDDTVQRFAEDLEVR